MNAFEEKMWERREGREEGERIGEKRGKKIGERIGEERGRKEGVAQGEKTKQREIARRMVEMKMALDIISKATGLTERELKALKKRN